jgi:hypothetical protein
MDLFQKHGHYTVLKNTVPVGGKLASADKITTYSNARIFMNNAS